MRGYFVYDPNESDGIAVVAHTLREAKKLGFHELSDNHGTEWTEVAAYWQKESNVEGLEVGIVKDSRDALRRGMYSYVENTECEVCGKITTCEQFRQKIVCMDCLLSVGDDL